MTRTSRFDFGSGTDPEPAFQWDTKCKLFSLVKVSSLPSALLVCNTTPNLGIKEGYVAGLWTTNKVQGVDKEGKSAFKHHRYWVLWLLPEKERERPKFDMKLEEPDKSCMWKGSAGREVQDDSTKFVKYSKYEAMTLKPSILRPNLMPVTEARAATFSHLALALFLMWHTLVTSTTEHERGLCFHPCLSECLNVFLFVTCKI